MTCRWPSWVVAATCLIGALPVAADEHEPTVPSLSNTQVERLARGDVLVDVVSGEAPYGDAIGVINAPPTRVMDIISDFNGNETWQCDPDSAEASGQGGESFICHGVTDTPWPMRDREWSVRAWGGSRQLDGVNALVSTWRYIPDSGNIVDTRGYWLLIPWGTDGSQTLVRYHLMVNLGSWLPDFLLEWSTENFLPAKISDLRDRLMN